ncbi:MAG: alkaline phosphatase family protein [Promethearchaeota archaeon]
MTNIVIGIDGGCFEHIEPLLKENLLPNIKKIIENGFFANLEETIPPITVPSWACLFSGLTPEQLGYFDFVHPVKGLFSSHIWQNYSIFSLIKSRSFILNVPGTYPAWKINGEMIAGMMAPSLNCFPPELKFILEKNWIKSENSVFEAFKAYEIRKKLFLRKLKEDFEFMVYVAKIPDTVTHFSSSGENQTRRLIYLSYLKLDKLLGEILREKKVENIIIFSDHGLKHYDNELNIRRWLEKKGLIYINFGNGKILTSILLKLYNFIRPPYIKNNPLRSFYFKILNFQKKRIKDTKNLSRNNYRDVSLRRFSSNVGALFLQENEKKNTIEIMNMLKKDKNIKNVIMPNIDGFPDLYIILKDKFYFGIEPALYLKVKMDMFDHSEMGLFLAYGKDIVKGQKEIVNYLSVAPTILKLLNIKKPNYMKGTVLEIFKN